MSELTKRESMPCPNCVNNNGARCSIGLDVMPDLNSKGVCRGFSEIQYAQTSHKPNKLIMILLAITAVLSGFAIADLVKESPVREKHEAIPRTLF